jgi:uncharacterized protein (TIRG00374 family)
LLPIGIFASLLATGMTADLEAFSDFRKINFGVLAGVTVLAYGHWLSHGFRVLVWTGFLENPLSVTQCARIVIGSELGAAASPTAIGGGPFKLGLLIDSGLSPGTAMALTVLGSVEDYLFFIIGIPVMFWLNPVTLPAFQRFSRLFIQYWPYVLLAAAVVTVVGLMLRRYAKKTNHRKKCETPFAKIRNWFTHILDDFRLISDLIAKRGKWLLVLTTIVTACQWMARYSIVYFLVQAFGIDVSFLQVFLLQWGVFVLNNFVPTPGAMLGAEAGFMLLFKQLLPGSVLGLMMTAWRFFTYHLPIMTGALVFTVLNAKVGKKKTILQPESICEKKCHPIFEE